jgi:hypothetical protein
VQCQMLQSGRYAAYVLMYFGYAVQVLQY